MIKLKKIEFDAENKQLGSCGKNYQKEGRKNFNIKLGNNCNIDLHFLNMKEMTST